MGAPTGFQYWKGLMTWMIWGTPILGKPQRSTILIHQFFTNRNRAWGSHQQTWPWALPGEKVSNDSTGL